MAEGLRKLHMYDSLLLGNRGAIKKHKYHMEMKSKLLGIHTRNNTISVGPTGSSH